MRHLGVDLPANPTEADIGAEFQATMGVLAEVGVEGRSKLPLATDPEFMAAMRVQSRITSAAYFARPTLLPTIACRMVRASVKSGHDPATPYALSILGIVLNTVGMHAEAHVWGQAALSLSERFDDAKLKVRTGHVVHDLVCNWTVHLDETLDDVWKVYEDGKALGDVKYASYAAHAYIHNAMYAGHELESLLEKAIAIGDFMRSPDQVNALHVHAPFECLLRALTGRNQDPARLDGMPSAWHTPMFHQYSALAILGLEAEARAKLSEELESSITALEHCAAAGPMNFAHRLALVRAEAARVEGDTSGALDLCTQAISGARQFNWPNDLGIGQGRAPQLRSALAGPQLSGAGVHA